MPFRLAVIMRTYLSRAFFTDFPYVASLLRVFGIAAGRLHRFAMETCSARIDPHTVFALAPRANRLKNALKLPSQARQCSRFIACAVLPAAISGNTESARRIASWMSACSSGGGGLS